jgi:hypothetical protein
VDGKVVGQARRSLRKTSVFVASNAASRGGRTVLDRPRRLCHLWVSTMIMDDAPWVSTRTSVACEGCLPNEPFGTTLSDNPLSTPDAWRRRPSQRRNEMLLSRRVLLLELVIIPNLLAGCNTDPRG